TRRRAAGRQAPPVAPGQAARLARRTAPARSSEAWWTDERLLETEDVGQVQQRADRRRAERIGVGLVERLTFGAEPLDEDVADGILGALCGGIDDEHVD